MRVACYARFSSDKQKDSSIVDQIRNCETRATKEGWSIATKYEDRAISGSTKDRPGYQQMLKDAKAKAFDVLLVDDLSRLTRDEAELITTRKRLVFYGVRVIGCADGFDTDQKMHKIHAMVKGMTNEVFLDDLKEKIHRGLSGRATLHFHTGGRAYGYKHDPIFENEKLVGKKRKINPEQAQWVKWIYEHYAAGMSTREMANELNRLKVPGPSATHHRKCPSPGAGRWNRGVLQGNLTQGAGILGSELYKGLVIWNRREVRRDPEIGKKVARFRTEGLISYHDKDLDIVGEDLWNQVQARRRAQKGTERKAGRPAKYLLSGLLKCGTCGGNFVVGDGYRMTCGRNMNNGEQVCTNKTRVVRAIVEERCLARLRERLLQPKVVEQIVTQVTRRLAEAQKQRQPLLDQLPRQLAKVEGEIANIMTAIKAGIFTASTKAELEKVEAERTRIQAAMTPKAATVVTLLPKETILNRYKTVVEQLGSLSTRNVDAAREQLRRLVGDIKLVPGADGQLEAIMTPKGDGVLSIGLGRQLNNSQTVKHLRHLD